MSSGVSDQMKVPGNTAKNVEERNIPWSQQVDEASYENLASPNTDDNFAANQSSMQFQYPPFNAKENQNSTWNSYKPRKPTNNFDSSKKYGKPAFYNNTKRDDFQPNAWSTSRRSISDNHPGNFIRTIRSDESNSNPKLDNRPMTNTSIAEDKKLSAPPVVAAPKKTTWASIASQPAKLTSRTTLTSSSHKKKGPGMPPPPMVPGKHNLDVINTWDLPNNNPPPVPSPPPPIDQVYTEINSDFSPCNNSDNELGGRSEKEVKGLEFPKDDKSNYINSNFGRVRNSPNGHSRKNWSLQHPLHQNRSTSGNAAGSVHRGESNSSGGLNRYNDRRGHHLNSRPDQDTCAYDSRDENTPRTAEQPSSFGEVSTESPQAVLDDLLDKNNYNPAEIDLERAVAARFFVIKSYSEDDIHRSIKYEIWCSTDHGNKRLDDAFKERHKDGGNILLFFSVNGSGHFCGMAQMMTPVDYNSTSSVWSQDKWKGKFKVKWIYVKDVPNIKLRHIRLENNDNKSVTNSRDTQEVPNAKGIEVLQILHTFKHTTSIFDDFYHYEKKQEEEVSSKKPIMHDISQNQSPINRQYNRQNDDRDRDRGAQKYFACSGASGGSTNFRDRNISHRGGYHNNYNDHRRFDGHRTNDYQQKERDVDLDRENTEYGIRTTQKFDYNRRDERTQTKHNNRDRDFSEDHNKSESRFRSAPREMQKDNEYPISDRIRNTDY